MSIIVLFRNTPKDIEFLKSLFIFFICFFDKSLLLLAFGYWLWVILGRLLAIGRFWVIGYSWGDGLLAIGYWRWVMGYGRSYSPLAGDKGLL
jgi:hypothetical protein